MSQALSGVTVVFDLDGTLVDTAPDILGALNDLLAEQGLGGVAPDAAGRLIGGGVQKLLERGYREIGAPLNPQAVPALARRFVELYAPRVARESRPYPGAVAALDTLAADGARLAICTNKPTELATALLDGLGLSARFAAVLGPDAVVRGKPDRTHFDSAVRRAGGDPALALMIGDSQTDVATARAAGVPIVLVPWGYTTAPAASLGADVVIGEFGEIPGAVRRLLS